MAQVHNKNLHGQHGPWHIYTETEVWSMVVKIYIIYQETNGKRMLVSLGKGGEIIMAEYKEGVLADPTFVMPNELWIALQDLTGDLKQPTIQGAAESKLEAVNKHLEDLRTIAFYTLKIKKYYGRGT